MPEEEILNLEAALEMIGGEKDLLLDLLGAFLHEAPFDEAKLLSLEAKEDTTEAAKYVHYYKGAARQLGAEKLAKSGQALEDVLRKKTSGDIPSLNKNFIVDYRQAAEAIQDTLEIL